LHRTAILKNTRGEIPLFVSACFRAFPSYDHTEQLTTIDEHFSYYQCLYDHIEKLLAKTLP